MIENLKVMDMIRNIHNETVEGNFDEDSYKVFLMVLLENGIINMKVKKKLNNMVNNGLYCSCSLMYRIARRDF